jgi:hypothetical protein
MRGPGKFLDKESPIQGPWCRFRREARARERRDIDTVVVDSLKALDPKRPIREADIVGDWPARPLSVNNRHLMRGVALPLPPSGRVM